MRRLGTQLLCFAGRSDRSDKDLPMTERFLGQISTASRRWRAGQGARPTWQGVKAIP
jgi:hypothetical protein